MHAHIKKNVVKSLVDYGNIHITQHALKASVFKIMKLDTIQKKKSMSHPLLYTTHSAVSTICVPQYTLV